MEIKRDFRNDLLKRKEIEVLLSEKGNPGFANCQKILASELKALEEVIVVRNVKNNFGSNEFLVDAFIYDSKEDLESIEPKKKEKKKAGGSS